MTSTEDTPAIDVAGLVKNYGDHRAVDSVDLTVARGQVLGLLGPNGAGKTTMVRILATLLRPDEGRAHVLGHDLVRHADQIRRRIAVTGQSASIDDDLSGFENLWIQARLRGLSHKAATRRAHELLSELGLDAAARRPVGTYSGGMRRRADLAGAMVVTPELLFLDEPTTGLDPVSRAQVWDWVRDLVARGTTVLLTTQYLDEADNLADRIAVLDRGRIVADGTPTQLKNQVGAGSLQVQMADQPGFDAAERLLGTVFVHAVHAGRDPLSLRVRVGDQQSVDAQRAANDALARLTAAGHQIIAHSFGRPSLDEVYLALTGHAPESDASSTEEENAA
jgi:ABC-2 type transport system ATP-binding protein